jgi:hypothetical protein
MKDDVPKLDYAGPGTSMPTPEVPEFPEIKLNGWDYAAMGAIFLGIILDGNGNILVSRAGSLLLYLGLLECVIMLVSRWRSRDE